MNYYIQGNAANADKIKAAFEKLGIDVLDFGFADKTLVYCSIGGAVQCLPYSINLMHILYSHPDYKELELHIESKFKVGDWVVENDNGTVSQITKTINGKDEYGEYRAYEHTNGYFAACFENEYHLWTIQDAKDGDVLYSLDSKQPFIYKVRPQFSQARGYCCINKFGDFAVWNTNKCIICTDKYIPATKEQRDLLFQKMKEAGYTWDEKKKELCKIIEPQFKVGDDIKTGNTIETIAEVDHDTRSYYCESGRTIYFANQDLWHLVPKPHYDISNFYAGMPVLVRADNNCRWDYSVFSRITGNEDWQFAVCNGVSVAQCIPFEGNEHLLGTTDMPSEEYINW